MVLSLYHHYGVSKVYGFRFGYEGLVQRHGHKPMELTPDNGEPIHEMGGTVLGSFSSLDYYLELAVTMQFDVRKYLNI